MYKIIWLFGLGLLLIFSTKLIAQKGYNIQLVDISQLNPNGTCYHIQLASADGIDFNLAGQNYRLYYNAEQFKFNPEKTNLSLSDQQYAPITIKDNLRAIDATGMGILPFEHHLGFINFGSDLNDLAEGGVTLPASGEWMTTAQICFDYIGQVETMPRMEIVWAREALTAKFATAYVEIAEWVAPFKSQAAEGIEFNDFGLSTSLNEEAYENTIRVYPNPTADFVKIDFEAKESTKLYVRSIDGKLVQQHILPKGSNQSQIDLTPLPSGSYNLEFYGSSFIIKRIEKIE